MILILRSRFVVGSGQGCQIVLLLYAAELWCDGQINKEQNN